MRKNNVSLTANEGEKIQVHLVIPDELLSRFDAVAARFHISRNTLNLFARNKFLDALERFENASDKQ